MHMNFLTSLCKYAYIYIEFFLFLVFRENKTEDPTLEEYRKYSSFLWRRNFKS